ncbi:uncharacterized protein LOC135139614 [Zophobas morio]|uniref:uncharacterized protein LOC135139614 n=1 Tax=Zophobas morio TaxID=2755281 RepID=UPI003082C2E4
MADFDWKSTIRINISTLWMTGLWPKHNDKYELNLYLLYAIFIIFFFEVFDVLTQAINVFFIFSDFDALMKTAYVLVTELLSVLKIYYFTQNVRIVKQLLATLDRKAFQPRTVKQKVFIEKDLKLWTQMYSMLWMSCMGALLFWAIFPILDGSYRKRQLPFLAWFPFDFGGTPLYQITYIYQILSTCLLAIGGFNVDTLIVALKLFAGSQFDILCDNLKNLNLCEGNPKEKLKSCFQHHREILRPPSPPLGLSGALIATSASRLFLSERYPAAFTDDESPIIAVHTKKPIGVVPGRRAQFDILCDNLKNLHLGEDDSKCKEKLKICFQHHREILSFGKSTNKFLNWIVFFQFFASAVSIGLIMFELTVIAPFSSEFYSAISYGGSIIVQAFMYCWYGNELMLKSGNLAYAIFEAEWPVANIEPPPSYDLMIARIVSSFRSLFCLMGCINYFARTCEVADKDMTLSVAALRKVNRQTETGDLFLRTVGVIKGRENVKV